MKWIAAGILCLGMLAMPAFAHTPAPAKMHIPIPKEKPTNQSCYASKEFSGAGMASWYGFELHGHKTADGGRFNMQALTAAHRTLPFGTRVLVTNKRNGRMIVVKITDRGPYAQGRIIDVSKEAARKLGFTTRGTAPVEIRKCISEAAYEREQKKEEQVQPKAKSKKKKR